MFFLGGGKCPNLGVVNVRILGGVNVLLANDSQSVQEPLISVGKGSLEKLSKEQNLWKILERQKTPDLPVSIDPGLKAGNMPAAAAAAIHQLNFDSRKDSLWLKSEVGIIV